ncbi:hypothetical protein [Streptomyces acidiscabies]|uniref:Uncharacterized protein n=1 Tax=Streptomyces acidiscabies TaxID=42234 RepID=A0ABU4LXU5_9ACTN|nr:hypothetical protein [Streptomyces acidiscabies]MDX3020040.1 hypothetical protein [Streptomyces acidiscabies]
MWREEITGPADELRDRLADAIRTAACDGNYGSSEADRVRQHVQVGVRHDGVVVEADGRPDVIATVVVDALRGRDVVSPPADRTAFCDRITEAIGPARVLGLLDADLVGEPGRERVGEWIAWISKTMAALPPPKPTDRAAVLDEPVGRPEPDEASTLPECPSTEATSGPSPSPTY